MKLWWMKKYKTNLKITEWQIFLLFLQNCQFAGRRFCSLAILLCDEAEVRMRKRKFLQSGIEKTAKAALLDKVMKNGAGKESSVNKLKQSHINQISEDRSWSANGRQTFLRCQVMRMPVNMKNLRRIVRGRLLAGLVHKMLNSTGPPREKHNAYCSHKVWCKLS